MGGTGVTIFETLERLFFLAVFGALALWFANDVKGDRKRDRLIICGFGAIALPTDIEHPFNYWANITVKTVSAVPPPHSNWRSCMFFCPVEFSLPLQTVTNPRNPKIDFVELNWGLSSFSRPTFCRHTDT